MVNSSKYLAHLRNLIDNYANFIAELTPILHYLSRSKSKAVIAGNFNIDLLKLNENDNFKVKTKGMPLWGTHCLRL